jgi:preprotein translocase subunit YajC
VYLASGSSGSGLSSILLLVVVFGAFYFLLLRPMKRRQQQAATDAKSMRETLAVGTEIVTIGGLYGTVVDMDDDSVTLEIAEGVHSRYDRAAIARVITPVDEVDEEETDEDEIDEDSEADDAARDDATDSTDLEATAHSIVEKRD